MNEWINDSLSGHMTLSRLTSLSLQRFPRHMSIKCHLLEIPHSFLSRWYQGQRKAFWHVGKLHRQIMSQFTVLFIIKCWQPGNCCRQSSTVVKWRGWFLTGAGIIDRDRGFCARKMGLTQWEASQSCLGFATLGWSLHLSGHFSLLFLSIKDTNCHQ